MCVRACVRACVRVCEGGGYSISHSVGMCRWGTVKPRPYIFRVQSTLHKRPLSFKRTALLTDTCSNARFYLAVILCICAFPYRTLSRTKLTRTLLKMEPHVLYKLTIEVCLQFTSTPINNITFDRATEQWGSILSSCPFA